MITRFGGPDTPGLRLRLRRETGVTRERRPSGAADRVRARGTALTHPRRPFSSAITMMTNRWGAALILTISAPPSTGVIDGDQVGGSSSADGASRWARQRLRCWLSSDPAIKALDDVDKMLGQPPHLGDTP